MLKNLLDTRYRQRVIKKKKKYDRKRDKMYVIAHHKFRSPKKLRKCPWTENVPIDQLVDDDNKILKFETKKRH